jgi:CMP-N-acetylneuraminic acid synthetase
MTTIAFIFARGGSKGVPRKNLALLGGKPLIVHSIEAGLACPGIDHVVVSTEDAEIAEVARAAGAEVPFMRPAELASDTASEILAWRHAVETLRAQGRDFDTMVSLPATSPLRSVEDIDAALTCFRKGDADFVISVTTAHGNPYFNMVALDETGGVSFPVRGETRYVRRQDAPTLWQITTVVYVTSPTWVLDAPSVYDGRVKAVFVPPERAVDIDTPLDLAFAEFLVSRRAGPA